MSTEVSRSRRDRPAKPPLSRDAIVDAALGVLEREGLAAVTMRRVAGELDTGAASLYVYVANRDALLHAMLDRLAASIPVEPPDPARWREQAKALLTRTTAALEAHPGIARVAMGTIPTGEGALRVSEALLGALRAGGVPDPSAAWAVDVLMLYATGAAAEHAVQIEDQVDELAVIEAVRERFATLPAERYPNIVAVLPFLTSGSGDERFAFGLDVLLNGLVATPQPTPAPASA